MPFGSSSGLRPGAGRGMPADVRHRGLLRPLRVRAACAHERDCGAPWAGLVDHGAGWWIEIGVEPLVAALEEALALTDERLGEMGCRGREWMAREFSWEAIGRNMAEFYRWLRSGGTTPASVRVD